MADITVVYAKHNLNISGLEPLARDLSQRLGATVRYGFWKETDEDIFEPIGSVEVAGTSEFILGEVAYELKNLCDTLPVEMREDWDYWVEESRKLRDFVHFELRTDQSQIAIFKECIEIFATIDEDWTFFRRNFLYKSSQDSVHNWRTFMQRWVTLMGGNEIFATGLSFSPISDNENCSWEQWILELTEAKSSVLSIPHHLATVSEDDKHEFIQYPTPSEVFHYLRRTGDYDRFSCAVEYPSYLYDDFRDLRQTASVRTCFDHDFPVAPKPEPIDVSGLGRPRNKRFSDPGATLVLECFISGLKYGDFGIIEPHLNHNQELELRREPGNGYDKRAIAVYLPQQNDKLGYIPSASNAILAAHMDHGFSYRCFVRYINEDAIAQGRYSLMLKVRIYAIAPKV